MLNNEKIKVAATDELEILRLKSSMSSSSKPTVQMLVMVLPCGGEQKTLGWGREDWEWAEGNSLLYRQSKIYFKNL
jgi:hypothetical protein